MKRCLFIWVVFLFFSCEKDPAIPFGKGNFVDVSTNQVSEIKDTRATTGISITNLTSQYNVQERGVCYGTANNPTISDAVIPAGANAANLTLLDLIPGQKYFVRSYARINGIFTYGNQREFITSANSSGMANGLVTYFPLNGDTRDYSSSLNNLNGTATKAQGRFGLTNSAYAFNGSSNFLTMLLPKNLPANNSAYSISVWFKADVWNREMTIMGYGPSGPSAASNYVKTLPSGGLLHYHWNLDYTITRSIFTNAWTHLVITYDGATERYYINGQVASAWPHGASPLFMNPSVLSIGARVVSAANNDVKEYFSGSVDELRIYNRALSANEATILHSL